jgi:ribosome-associated protein
MVTVDELINRGVESEFIYRMSRSSGPGGQNVNKVSTRVEIRFNIMRSLVFSEREKAMICEKLSKRISESGEIIVRSQTERTQLGNKQEAIYKLLRMLSGALWARRRRILTHPTTAAIKARERRKKINSEKKKSRKSPGGNFDDF